MCVLYLPAGTEYGSHLEDEGRLSHSLNKCSNKSGSECTMSPESWKIKGIQNSAGIYCTWKSCMS